MNIVKSDLETTFDERFKEYAYLWQVGEYYGAAKRLAELSHCLPNLDNEKTRKKWQDQIQSIGAVIPNEIVIALEDGVGKDAERISRILSVGTRWEIEEILLILGVRIEIDLMLAFLKEHCSHTVTITLYLEYIDTEIERLAQSKEHGGLVGGSISMMKKIRGLPLL